MPNHLFSLIAAAFLILFGNNFIHSPKAPLDITNMATHTTPKVPIEVELSSATNTASPLGSTTFHIKLTNRSPYPISILRWLTPLDTRATAIGVFTFTSTASKSAAWCLNLKLNRQLPVSGYFLHQEDDIVEIPGNGKVERDVDVKEPEVALIKGETYSVRAKGHWMSVWIHEKEGSESERLYSDAENLRRGDFESNEIVVEVSENLGGEV